MILSQRLKNFMDAWEKKDPGILDYCQLTWKNENSEAEKFFRDFYFDKDLLKYKVMKYSKIGKACQDAHVNIIYRKDGQVNKRKLKVRCLCESEAFKPTLDGEWGVNPISAIRGLN